MAKKLDFDYKAFLLQYGERIGLGVALFVLGLLLIFGLFWPGSGVFSGSPGKNAQDLDKKTTNARNLMRPDRGPNEDEKKSMLAINFELPKSGELQQADAKAYAAGQFFTPTPGDDNRRRQPVFEKPVDVAMAVFEVPVRSFMFAEDGAKIMVLRGPGMGGPQGGGQGQDASLGKLRNNLNQFRGGGSGSIFNMQPMMRGQPGGGSPGGPGGPGGGGAPGRPGMGMPGMGGGGSNFMRMGMGMPGMGMGGSPFQAGGDQKEKKKHEYVAIEDLEKLNDARPAVRALPVRGVLIEGVLPLKKQLEEVQRALHLPTLQAALQETQFRGFNLQRREIVPGRAPEEWDDKKHMIPHESNYRVLAALAGKEWARDDPKYDAVRFSGLWMNLPQLIGDHTYPALEGQFEKIKETLDNLRQRDQPVLAVRPRQFDQNAEFDPYSLDPTSGQPQGGAQQPLAPGAGAKLGAGGAGAGAKPGGGQQPDGGVAGGAAKPGGKGEEVGLGGYQIPQGWEPPEYCLFRVIDVTPMAPGKTYQYRMQVRMANPNLGRDKEVAYPELAKKKEIESPWFELPGSVRIPPDLHIYAVDLKEAEPRARHYQDMPADKDQMAFQLQKWVEEVNPTGGARKPVPVGEWTVLDRILIHKGEYVGGTYAVELPAFDFAQEDYILAAFSDPRLLAAKRVEVNFSDGTPPLLVDFGGGAVTYGKVKDQAPREVLLFTPDGKLLAHDPKADKDEEDKRKKRLDEWRNLVRTIRQRDRGRRPGGLSNDGGGDAFKQGGAEKKQ